MFQSLGRFTYRHRRAVITVWLVVLVVGMALTGTVMSQLNAQPGGQAALESTRVAQLLDGLTDRGVDVVAVVDGIDLASPTVRDALHRTVADVAAVPGVRNVVHPFTAGDPFGPDGDGVRALISTDGEAALVVAQLAGELEGPELMSTVDRVSELLRAAEAPSVEIGGTAVIDREFETAIERDLAAERKALPIAFVVMVVVLGGLIAAGLPLVIAFGAVAGSMFVLLAATGVSEISMYAMNVVFMFGLGLGIDYGLLVVSRFREERAAGASIPTAVEMATATAGRTVAFSAMTVAASLAGLFAFDDPAYRSFGIAGIGVVTVSLLAAVTLLPALLGALGRRIKPAPARRDGHRFARIAAIVQRRAVLTLVVVGGALIAVALPFLSARFESGDARYLPRSSEVRSVAMTLAERFPARGADPIQVVVADDADADAVATYTARIASLAEVAGVTSWTADGVTVIDVVPNGSSQGAVAQELVDTLRNETGEIDVMVGGTAAHLVDTKAHTAQRLPIAFAIIVVSTFVLLFLMTGSIAVPLKAIVMNVLSLGATFGALVWGFQDGHLSGLLGFDPVGSLDLFMPVLIFIFAFGLSMDYEVFLLGRIKEIYDRTGDNDRAVAEGLQRTGGIVTSAALLIVIVFSGFAMGEVLGIKMLGFGLALAVAVDAVIVRTLLVPATMKLLGHRNWWAPAPLRRLHQRFGLHEAPSAPLAPAEPTPATHPADDVAIEFVTT
jgi:putative drug exporter of the RND superfamily